MLSPPSSQSQVRSRGLAGGRVSCVRAPASIASHHAFRRQSRKGGRAPLIGLFPVAGKTAEVRISRRRRPDRRDAGGRLAAGGASSSTSPVEQQVSSSVSGLADGGSLTAAGAAGRRRGWRRRARTRWRRFTAGEAGRRVSSSRVSLPPPDTEPQPRVPARLEGRSSPPPAAAIGDEIGDIITQPSRRVAPRWSTYWLLYQSQEAARSPELRGSGRSPHSRRNEALRPVPTRPLLDAASFLASLSTDDST